MPRVCSPGAAYGCGHHAEHIEAARKGWLTRRRNAKANKQYKQVADAFSQMFDGKVTHIHAHRSHPGEVRFKQDGEWKSLPKKEFLYLANIGVQAAKEREKAERKAAQDAENERKRGVQRAQVAERQREAQRVADLRYEEAVMYAADEDRRNGYKAISAILAKNGIADPHYRGEVEYLPERFRRVNKRRRGWFGDDDRGTYNLERVGYLLEEYGIITESEREESTLGDFAGLLQDLEEKYNPNGYAREYARAERAHKKAQESKRDTQMRRNWREGDKKIAAAKKAQAATGKAS